jgi:hypothetical protein
MRISWKWVAANCAVLIAVAASVAIAAPSGGGTSSSSSSDGARRSSDGTFEIRREGPGKHLSALAKKLGVSEAKLREAFANVKENLDPPPRPDRGNPPSRADLEKLCNELTDALAKELGKSGDQVRDAAKAVLKDEIEAAVDDERPTRAQADRMLERINSAGCLPPFGIGLFKHGCGPGPGHGPGGPGPRGDENGNGAAFPAPPPDGGGISIGVPPV